MQCKYDLLQENEQDPQKASQEIAQDLEVFLFPLVSELDTLLDKRLVRTLVQCCVAIIRFRTTKQGLLLSELGSDRDGYYGLSRSAAAGTKSISNLMRSLKCRAFHMDRYVLEEADKEVKRLQDLGKRILCIWDGSVVEKPESSTAEGLCPVLSSTAKRRNRSRRGHVFNLPAARPVMLTGMHPTGALLAGLAGLAKIALMSCWTTKGAYATKTRQQEEAMLRKCVKKGGDILVHVCDRGDASGPCRKKHHFFESKAEEKKLWHIGRETMPCDIWWTSLWHTRYAYALSCVKVRVKQKVCYLVTNEPVKTEAQAWESGFIYKRRVSRLQAVFAMENAS
jgi:hypothetical protein